jgi:hypothetical protein
MASLIASEISFDCSALGVELAIVESFLNGKTGR